MEPTASRTSQGLYAATIFVGAFLLFQVQPIVGKFVLPWFGGSAGVWAAALLFFQLFLLFGYLYAHLITTWLDARGQAIAHLGLLAVALLALPIIPSPAWKPATTDNPVLNIILLLAVTVGAPYLLLAANGPLLQGWFARQFPGRSPYRLYALSNIASLVALLSYPATVERLLPLRAQAWLWTGTYVLFSALCALIAYGRLREARRSSSNPASTPDSPALTLPPEALSLLRVALWLLLPAVASALLLATTNRLTQEIAPVPLLWVLPLSIYLLTFILTFDSDRWYHPAIYLPITLAFLGAAAYTILRPGALTLVQESGVLLGALYFAAMLCHGELVALRPGVRRLTAFYLTISAGGAIGGALVAIGAPAFLEGYWEYHIALVIVAVVAAITTFRHAFEAPTPTWRGMALFGTGVAAGVALTLGVMLRDKVQFDIGGRFLVTRNFYSALQVQELFKGDATMNQYQMVHGQTLHGMQFLNPERRAWHTSYFGDDSGLGIAIQNHPRRLAGLPLRIGVIGLGSGSIGSYAQHGDTLRYYEIDPQVETIARAQFSYLEDASKRGATVDVLLGDGRIVLERERDAGQLQAFDIFVMDAFNSDSVPVHLLTKQALALYREHLAPGGMITVNVSNRFLDLTPVVRALAADAGLQARLFVSQDSVEHGTNRSEFVILTDNAEFLASNRANESAPIPVTREPVLWSDEYSALLPLLRF